MGLPFCFYRNGEVWLTPKALSGGSLEQEGRVTALQASSSAIKDFTQAKSLCLSSSFSHHRIVLCIQNYCRIVNLHPETKSKRSLLLTSLNKG